jgi:hypothetical protein
MSQDIAVRQATIGDLELLVPLFDAYRQFYRKVSDMALARQFLLERFQHNQSVILPRIAARWRSAWVYTIVSQLFLDSRR